MKKILIILFLFFLLLPLFSNENCTILIFPFENRSNDYWDEEYGIKFAKMITYLLDYITDLNFIDIDELNNHIKNNYFSITKAQKSALKIGKDFNADYVITGNLYDIQFTEKETNLYNLLDISIDTETQIAKSYFSLEIISVNSGEKLGRYSNNAIASTAQVDIDSMGGGDYIDEDALINKSLSINTLKALKYMDEIIFRETFNGIVKEIDKKNIIITGGKQLGIENNKKVEFYRIIGVKKEEDKINYIKENIGIGRIIKVKSDYAVCTSKSDIKQGDRIKIIK